MCHIPTGCSENDLYHIQEPSAAADERLRSNLQEGFLNKYKSLVGREDTAVELQERVKLHRGSWDLACPESPEHRTPTTGVCAGVSTGYRSHWQPGKKTFLSKILKTSPVNRLRATAQQESRGWVAAVKDHISELSKWQWLRLPKYTGPTLKTQEKHFKTG